MRTEFDFTNFIYQLLQSVNIAAEFESTTNFEIANALSTASKNLTGRQGYPDNIAVIKDYVLIMENKSDRTKLFIRDGQNFSDSIDAIKNFAVNGAIFYAKKILEQTHYKKIFAFGNAGDRKHHIFKPIFVGENIIKELPEVETFKNFTEENIDAYYKRMVLGEESAEEIELKKILRHAQILHEYLRSFGQLGETEKPLVVSAILLALAENLDCNRLTGDNIETDGIKIFNLVETHLKRAKVTPEFKREQVLDQFRLIKNRPILNSKNKNLDKTPLRYFAEFIQDNIFDAVIDNSAEDYLGRFYGEFISYSGGDGQSLGVVLTPSHIAELFCELVDLKVTDTVFDPCCGTGSFLISAMSKMMSLADDSQKKHIKQKQIHGIELREDMFSVATTNMILRGDGQSNLICGDFFAKNSSDLQLLGEGLTVGFMNPPYSQAKNPATAHLSELRFILHLLDSITAGGRVAVIVPVSAMIGKTRDDKIIKSEILRRHTLEGVISLNKNTFYRIGTVPCIAVFTAGESHPNNKLVKFINFENDGWEVQKHWGLVETECAKDRKQFLLNCWRGKISDVPSKFMVQTAVDAADEWLHSFYYYNDELPADIDFSNSVADYLTFEFNMISHGRGYLFDDHKKKISLTDNLPPLSEKVWKIFNLSEVFSIRATSSGIDKNKLDLSEGKIPYITRTDKNNGVQDFVCNQEKYNFDNGNCITVGLDTQTAFYQSTNFYTGQNIQILTNKNLNIFNAKFLLPAIKKTLSIFSWGGNGATLTRLKRSKIILPVNGLGEPDFEYMEKYIYRIEQNILREYLEKISVPTAEKVLPLSEKVWKEFFIEEIFEIKSGKRLTKNEMIAGDIPFIGATDSNNGITNFVGNKNSSADKNVLGVNYNGSVVENFYHPYEAIFSDDVKRFKLKNFESNKYIYLFLKSIILQQKNKYTYGYKFNGERMKKQKILLPVNELGEPDFEYMENYIKNIEEKILREYLEK